MGIFDRIRAGSVTSPLGSATGGGGGGGGTVTSVALAAPGIFSVSGSPVTTTGTLTFALATQVANTIFAGPGTGIDAAPTFRALVAADIPALSYQAPGNYITALTGDVTASGPGSSSATIATNAVTNTKLAQMAANTFKANNTGATANASDITGTQATVLLDVFTSALKGLAPASGGGTTNFLRADGTWTTPAAAAPTGTANTVAYFNGSGALSSESSFAFITSTKSFLFFSGTAGSVTSTNSGSFAGGFTATNGTIGSTGRGSYAFGWALSTGGQILSSDDGTFAGGYANVGKILSENAGSFAFGTINGNTSSRIRAATGGSVAMGSADTGGIVVTTGTGSFALGFATGSASATLNASNSGAFSMGMADGGSILASGIGSQARGYAQNGGTLRATATGSFASGRAISNSSTFIEALGIGAHAIGSASVSGVITASGRGSFAGGSVDASTELTVSSGEGAFSFGHSHDVSADFGTAHGIGHLISSFSAMAVGQFATVAGTVSSSVATEIAFAVGIGTSTAARLNAFSIGKNADIKVYRTITAAATTGNQTIDRPSGTVNFAAAATTLTVTNSLVTANSIILAVVRTNDTTATIKNVVPAAGSFVINLGAAATAETSVGFLVLN